MLYFPESRTARTPSRRRENVKIVVQNDAETSDLGLVLKRDRGMTRVDTRRFHAFVETGNLQMRDDDHETTQER